MDEQDLFAACARALGDGWDGRTLRAYPEAAKILEDDIEQRGFRQRYITALAEEAGAYTSETDIDVWMLLRAKLRQRCRAYLKARGL